MKKKILRLLEVLSAAAAKAPVRETNNSRPKKRRGAVAAPWTTRMRRMLVAQDICE